MASPQIAPTPSVTPTFASLGRRIGAYLIDILLVFCVLAWVAITFRVLRAAGIWTPGGGAPPDVLWRALGIGAKLAVLLAFVIAGGPIYLILFECSPWQATLGKRLLNIYVTDNGGRRISLGRSFGRRLAMWMFTWVGALISLITIAASREKKALHDFAAGTLVVAGRPIDGGALESWRPLLAFALPYFWILGTYMVTLR
jgi:uncharacterized RDD family membrane protein YckC